jgi:hypothetical protein
MVIVVALARSGPACSWVNAAFMAPRATTALPPMTAANTLTFLRFVELISILKSGYWAVELNSSERLAAVKTLLSP